MLWGDNAIDENGAKQDDYGIKLVSSAEPKLREVVVPKVSLMGKSKRKMMTNGSESTNKDGRSIKPRYEENPPTVSDWLPEARENYNNYLYKYYEGLKKK